MKVIIDDRDRSSFYRIPGFEIAIAITIPIENLIRIDRDPIFMLKSDRGFIAGIGS